MQRTPFYSQHLEAGAKMVDFAGWEMPIHYGSQLQEHKQVRSDAGMFDVSHMVVLDLQGSEAKPYLLKLLANNVDKLKEPGKALYSCMLTAEGGVIDDLIVYYLSATSYRLVVNAATRAKDLAWMQAQLQGFDASLTERSDLAMLAVQGPNARAKVFSLMPTDEIAIAEPLQPFYGAQIGTWFIARTGYTGEDGFEMMFPAEQAAKVWAALIQAGIAPTGLGARDTLRLEAGMNLYGTDMDETTSPLTSGLAWTIAWQPAERDFIGRQALEAEKAAGVQQKWVGLVLEGKGVLRNHMRVICEAGEGEITSGSFSPTLGLAIALARVPAACGDHCLVDIRGKLQPAKVVKPVFVRHGQSVLS
ncbi:aminomethyltransferase [Thiothrix eikelboomii]|uniref:Aminomethyltransferase n=1 Tax=Thiothrix eikelboomii TaxID=92487 RepID=A0A1T4XKL5_9GAMM|nr:glycine cleavage system aminomethyltransferase GcvT [Thiothrix eikelboomii]SKA90102.1 aminomethyltransferase [Thiothrix eikelboomii]